MERWKQGRKGYIDRSNGWGGECKVCITWKKTNGGDIGITKDKIFLQGKFVISEYPRGPPRFLAKRHLLLSV